jgi:hypothetical protein
MVLRLSTFPLDVQGVILTGFSTGSSAPVATTDSVIVGLGKLQAQLNLKAPLANPTFTGTVALGSLAVVGNNTTQGTASLNGPTATSKWLGFQTTGTDRWQIALDGATSNSATGIRAVSTAYALNAIINNGANCYKVTTAGTSGTSGGPTGTGTGITDGTVVWAYVGPANQGDNLALWRWDDPRQNRTTPFQINRATQQVQIASGVAVTGGTTTDTLAVSGAVTGAGFTGLVQAQAATVAPLIDGTAAVGTSLLYARQDHVHPTDTSRYAASNPSGFQTAAQVAASVLSSVLTGLSTATSAAIAATDSVLTAFGKLQAQISSIATKTNSAAGAALVGFLSSATGAVGRTLQAKLLDTPSLGDFGTVGNGVANDTAAVAAAMAAIPVVYAPPGTYSTTTAVTAFNGAAYGPGQIIDGSGDKRGKFFTSMQAAPTSVTSNYYSFSTVFNGDLSHQIFSIDHQIRGAATLGTPTTGFVSPVECFPVLGYVTNYSGHIQNNATGDGQTGGGFAFLNVEHHGQGNMCALNVYGQSYGSNPSATGFLAYPSIGLMAGQVTAGATGTYLNPVEVHCVDNGFDSASINYVATQIRSNSTGAIGASWVGYLSASQGTALADAIMIGQGSYHTGIDLSPAGFTNQAAIVIGSDQRIYMNAQNTGGYPPGTSIGGAYLVCFSGNMSMYNGPAQISLGTAIATITVPLSVTGTVGPTADNTYDLGYGGLRWANVYAVNGAIQTSDPTLKTDIAALPSALPIIAAINPITFKWKVGGFDTIETQEEQEVQATETIIDDKTSVEIRDGKPVQVKTSVQHERLLHDAVPVLDETGNPVMVDVGGKRGPVRMAPLTHPVPRMVKQAVTVKKQVERAGKRTHWGFLAPDVKAAFDAQGMDFGGYVQAEDGTHHLRPDQLIPVLWKAVQELSAKVAALEGKQ